MANKDFVTVYHDFHDAISEKTKVIFLGETAMSITHKCTCQKTKELTYPVKVDIFQATHNTAGAGYCKFCDTLYIAKEPTNERQDSKDGEPVHDHTAQRSALSALFVSGPDCVVREGDTSPSTETGVVAPASPKG